MVDNEQHLELLETFMRETPQSFQKWDIFIKIDVGSKRAGVWNELPRLKELVRKAESSNCVSIYGFYCHAGHSYSCRTVEEAQAVLRSEVDGVLGGAALLSSDKSVIASIGATPTAHVVETLQTALPKNVTLELHAGELPSLLPAQSH